MLMNKFNKLAHNNHTAICTINVTNSFVIASICNKLLKNGG
jgi:hypothetical protein